MKIDKTYRINGFEQIKAFYSWVFNNAGKRVTPQHISLYIFLVNQNNRSNWVEWFKVPYDLAMAGACIGNKKTYYTCLADLTEWNLIEYEKGINEWKAPLIKLVVLKCTSTDTASVPLPEPLPTPQVVPLPIPLPTHIYKQVTDNIQRITDNLEIVLKYLDSLNPDDSLNEEVNASEIIAYLNEKAEKDFKPSSRKTLDLITARRNEGWKQEDFIRAINNKVADWKDDPEYDRYLCPTTLFSPKFEKYVNQKIISKKGTGPAQTDIEHQDYSKSFNDITNGSN